ncbi:hypothetical protein C8R43DRAFT_959538 [Mycena crocata]|nr:hypothetical protein C8R43DRAFT_959538 [Mycena crocata]
MSPKRSPAFTLPFISHPTEGNAWYMATAPLADGAIISRDRAKMFDVWDSELADPEYGFDASDYATYAASTYQQILRFLPRCPGFQEQYERQPTGKFKQVGMIYFVVDNCKSKLPQFREQLSNLPFTQPSIAAVQKLNALPDPLAAIFVTSEKEEAERRIR